jgi:hypothetical protein
METTISDWSIFFGGAIYFWVIGDCELIHNGNRYEPTIVFHEMGLFMEYFN